MYRALALLLTLSACGPAPAATSSLAVGTEPGDGPARATEAPTVETLSLPLHATMTTRAGLHITLDSVTIENVAADPNGRPGYGLLTVRFALDDGIHQESRDLYAPATENDPPASVDFGRHRITYVDSAQLYGKNVRVGVRITTR